MLAASRLGWLAVGCLCVSVIPIDASPITIATFTVTAIDGGARVDGEENTGFPFFQGDPDRYFSMGIFDQNSMAVFSACAAGCLDDADASTVDGATLASLNYSTGTGFYDFADRTITKVLSGEGAYFYFGLWDDDSPLDAADSLGDHWFFAAAPVSGSNVGNNNSSPYFADNPISTVGGRDVEGIGSANNYGLYFSVTFQRIDDPDVTPVPEPATLSLLAFGLAGAAGYRRVRNRRTPTAR